MNAEKRPSKLIRVSLEFYQFIQRKAKQFETREQVLRRLCGLGNKKETRR
jgi:hypothetical protein